MITNDAFFEHFKGLANSKEVIQEIGPNVDNTVFEELDEEITENEIRHAIKHLKRGKSHGLDNIINEYFIEFSDSLIPLLNTLFNKIFSSGIFPKAWSNCVIVPIFKKGDANDPNNYRGISLITCFCKLFTSILNNRLIE